MRKRILVITHAGGSPFHGPNMRWYYLGLALKPLGVDVEIVSSSSFHKYISPPRVEAALETCDVGPLKYHWIKTRPYSARGVAQVINQIEFVLGCYRQQDLLRTRAYDVVLASSPHPFVAYPALSLARKVGAEFFFEVRDLWPAVLLELTRFSRWHPYILALKAAESFAVKHAKKILSVKPGDGDYFSAAYGIVADRVAYLPNGFLPGDDIGSIPAEIESLRKKYRILVGYVGGVTAYYRLEDMVELASRCADYEDIGFVIVGKGDRSEAVKDAVRSANLTNVHLVGAIDKQDVPAAIARFDICYVGLADLDIHRYGISCNKIYEYMHACKPILGSYWAGRDPVVEANCGFTARPGQYDTLAAKLRLLADDENLRKEYGQRGRQYFDEYHDFQKVAEKLKDTVFPRVAV